MKSINDLSKEVYANAVSKGWYENGAANNIGERICLIHSELSEALEADRKHKYANDTPKGVDILKDDEVYKEWFETHVKDTFEDEIADVVIRCLDMSAHLGFNLEKHIEAKMRYNTLRPIRHGGKKY